VTPLAIAFGRRQTFALALVSALAWMSFAALPYEIGTLAAAYRLSPLLAGWLSAAELFALASLATWFGRSIEQRNKQLLTLIGLAVGSLAALICLAAKSVMVILIARLIFGAGMGAVAAATNALPTYHSRPERMFAYMMVGLALIFSFLMYAAPAAIAVSAGHGLFALELALIIVIGPLAFLLPAGVRTSGDAPEPSAPRWRLPAGTLRVLIGLTLTLIGQGACWAFAEQAAGALRIDASHLTLLFTVSGLMSLAGALAATALGLRLGYSRSLYIGYAVQIFTGVGMYCLRSHVAFAAGVILLNAAGMFSLPYIQGVLAELDVSGRGPALSGAAINFGAAAGPAAGALLSILPGLKPIGVATTVMFVASIALVLSGARLIRPNETRSMSCIIRNP
jgi:predicted MFS family arabinose efflux permease